MPEPASFDVGALGKKGDLGDAAFNAPVEDPYMTNPILRASDVMAELSAERVQPRLMAAE